MSELRNLSQNELRNLWIESMRDLRTAQRIDTESLEVSSLHLFLQDVERAVYQKYGKTKAARLLNKWTAHI